MGSGDELKTERTLGRISCKMATRHLKNIALGVAVVIPLLTFCQVERLAQDTTYLSLVQVRIAGCFASAAHHRSAADLDIAGSYVSNFMLKIQDVDRPVRISSNEERFAAASATARALVICAGKGGDTDNLKECVDQVSATEYLKVHDYAGDDRALRAHPNDDKTTHEGLLNPAC